MRKEAGKSIGEKECCQKKNFTLYAGAGEYHKDGAGQPP